MRAIVAALIAALAVLSTASPSSASQQLDPTVDWPHVAREVDRFLDALDLVDQIDLTAGEIAMRNCESSHSYTAVSRTGKYRGAWQFDQPTWDGAATRAGAGHWAGQDIATAPQHIQDRAMRQLRSERGAQPWPECGRYIR